ncbi:hypothetical protein [Mammaliicoccus sciuri]|uniref:hypothetical protein n=1 Tax=Mammaliicoccus sciuri TaxID=1296 RepID=UPI002DBF02BD|nr:hypothetical protein [Mammaliicoccus sciuri]MEB7784201.1 hypothetical protein [Mammaliicoccus sciuri]
MMLPIEKGHIVDMLIGENKIGIFRIVKVEEKYIWGIKMDEYFIINNSNKVQHNHIQNTIINRVPIVEPFNIFGLEYDDSVYLESKHLAEIVLEYVIWGDESVLFRNQ